MNAAQMQYRAFLAVVVAALAVALAPIIVAGVRGEALPAGLIDIADKSVVAFAGLLGTIGALLFRQSSADAQATENTKHAFDTIRAAQEAPSSKGPTGNPGDPVHTTEEEA